MAGREGVSSTTRVGVDDDADGGGGGVRGGNAGVTGVLRGCEGGGVTGNDLDPSSGGLTVGVTGGLSCDDDGSASSFLGRLTRGALRYNFLTVAA